jgi:EmrB/QacA subfamily drug resistance transporter
VAERPADGAHPHLTAFRPIRLLPVGLGTLVVPFDTAVNVAFPAITQAFGLAIPSIQWIVICYVLTYASLLLAFGRIGDILGHAVVFRVGLAVSVVGFLLCAAGPTYPLLLAARMLQGIGAALVLSCGPALATGLFDEAFRARALGFYGMVMAVGAVLGQLLGGMLVEFWGWPAVFWFRAPIAAAALLLSLRLPATPREPQREPFDALGAGLLALGLSTLLLAVNRFRHLAEDWSALVLTTVAIAGITGFIVQQRRSPRPIIDLRVFRDLDFSLANLGNVLVNLAGFASLLLVPYYLVRAAGVPVMLAGLLMATGAGGAVLAAPVAGRLIGRLSPYVVALLGALLMAVGLFLVGSWGERPQLALILATLVTQGCGVGLFQVAYLEIVTGAIPRRDRGVAGSLAMLTRTIGVVAGATLLSLSFQAIEAAQGFLPAFQRTFQFAATVPAAVALALLLRLPATRA